MTSTTIQTDFVGAAMSSTLEDEIYLLSPSLSQREPTFHYAAEDPVESKPSLLDRLPASFQELLLISVDPETFASLSVVNRHWRQRSNTPLLYAYHLAKCTASTDDQQKKSWSEYRARELPELKRLFAREAKRHLFSLYRPKKSTFRLTAPPAVSASAVPHGEAFTFAFSSNGARAALCSSSRMFIMDLRREWPDVSTAFALQRRPTAVEISNDGLAVAVLSPEWRITTYSIEGGRAQLLYTFLLDEPATTLALSPDGSLLAAAQTHGIEFFSLLDHRGVVSRRRLACEPVTHLEFAENGNLLIGTNSRFVDATTTIVHASPHSVETYEEEQVNMKSAELWLSQPLFPSSFGKTTHALPIPAEDTRILAFDAPAESFGALDHQRMKFTSPLLKADRDLVMSTVGVPSLTSDGCLAAFPVSGRGIQVMGLPHEDSASTIHAKDNFPHLTETWDSAPVTSKSWQRWIPLSEKAIMSKWIAFSETVSTKVGQRLLVVGPGGSSGKKRESSMEEPRDTGMMYYFDFDFRISPNEDQESTIDLSNIFVQPMEEGDTEDDAGNALARQSMSSRASDKPRNVPLARSVTSARHRRRSVDKNRPAVGADDLSPEERHLDAPYVPSEPRPQGTLQRNRTARVAHENRPRSMPAGPMMRNPQGRGEIPDESDADNWVPPPPVYAKEPDSELPDELKETLRPPTPPPKSQNRKSASTPNLLADHSVSLGQSKAEASGAPAPSARSRAPRSRTFVENARRSVLFSRDNLRRVTSGPIELLTNKNTKESSQDPPKDPADEVSLPSSDENAPVLSSRPRTESKSASQNRRRSFLERPLSLYTNLRGGSDGPSNNRSVSQPLDRTSTPPHSASPQPESPALPSPSQVASLHRRQTSGSISSLRSENSTAPRAAVGAHRRTTNSMSPWSSTLMLNTVSETEGGVAAGSRPVSMHFNGSPGPSRPLSMHMNGSATPSERKSTVLDENSSRNFRPPTRLQETSRASSSRHNTSGSERRRSVIAQASRLSAIPSMASLKAFASNTVKRGERSPSAGVKRSGSKRLQRKDSVRKRDANATSKESLKKKLGRLKGLMRKNLESV